MAAIEIVRCVECGVCFSARPAAKRKYCSSKCVGSRNSRLNRGENNPKWRGGEMRDPQGRVMIYRPGHHLATMCDGSYAYRYRIVAEEALGRPLEDGEIVHHINGDTSDDRPENLAVMTQGEHFGAELRQRQIEAEANGRRIAGVRLVYGKSWQARGHMGKKQIYLGTFSTREDAEQAVKRFRDERGYSAHVVSVRGC